MWKSSELRIEGSFTECLIELKHAEGGVLAYFDFFTVEMHLELLFVNFLADIKEWLARILRKDTVLNLKQNVLTGCQPLVAICGHGQLGQMNEALNEEVLESEALPAEYPNQVINTGVSYLSESFILLGCAKISVGQSLEKL